MDGAVQMFIKYCHHLLWGVIFVDNFLASSLLLKISEPALSLKTILTATLRFPQDMHGDPYTSRTPFHVKRMVSNVYIKNDDDQYKICREHTVNTFAMAKSHGGYFARCSVL